jgi:hypothetical protein
MATLSKSENQAIVDAILGRVLRRSFRQISRRSFLSGLTRNVFSLAGEPCGPSLALHPS